MRYSLLLHSNEPKDGEINPEVIAEFMRAFDKYAKALEQAGVLLSADVLQPSSASTTVTLKNGELQIEDGPFIDSNEQLAGNFVIDVPTLDAALAWAEKCPGAQYGVIEVRPTAVYFKDNQWQPAN
ncbi:YciI family protein [Alteromonas sp. AMM-1]|uniref:YciI family protein n=1 Tax=Alteromonas sp. AMM-1 TaxID=3394233 RepID=UPI0039A7393C